MKNVIFALAFMLVGTFAFANNTETTITEENVISLNEISTIDLTEESVFIELNSSPESLKSIKCWLFKRWLKRELRKVSNNSRAIADIADAGYKLCKLAQRLGWVK